MQQQRPPFPTGDLRRMGINSGETLPMMRAIQEFSPIDERRADPRTGTPTTEGFRLSPLRIKAIRTDLRAAREKEALQSALCKAMSRLYMAVCAYYMADLGKAMSPEIATTLRAMYRTIHDPQANRRDLLIAARALIKQELSGKNADIDAALKEAKRVLESSRTVA